MNQEPSVFTRIINRELPADIVFENERIIVIKNIKPLAPVHLLGITKQPFRHIHEMAGDAANKDLLWELVSILDGIASDLGLNAEGKGYRLTTNCGVEGGQSVFHLHVHLLGGMRLNESGLAK